MQVSHAFALNHFWINKIQKEVLRGNAKCIFKRKPVKTKLYNFALIVRPCWEKRRLGPCDISYCLGKIYTLILHNIAYFSRCFPKIIFGYNFWGLWKSESCIIRYLCNKFFLYDKIIQDLLFFLDFYKC